MADDEKYPQYVNGMTICSKSMKHYICHVCEKRPDETWKDHLKNKTHCSLVFAQEPTALWAPKDKFEILFRNFISTCENEYYCHLCLVKFSSWFATMSHTTDIYHETVRTAYAIELPASLSYELLSSNHIFLKTPNICLCVLCNLDLEFSRSIVLHHISTMIHEQRAKLFTQLFKATEGVPLTVEQTVNQDSLKEDTDKLIKRGRKRKAKMKLKKNRRKKKKLENGTDNQPGVIKKNNVGELQHAKVSSISMAPEQRVYFVRCDICGREVATGWQNIISHNESQGHQKRKSELLRKNQSAILTDLDPNTTGISGIQYFITAESVGADKSLIKIQKVWNKSALCDRKTFIWCEACKLDLSQVKIKKHSATNEHQRNAEILLKSIINNKTQNLPKNYEDYISIVNVRIFKCRLCNIGGPLSGLDRHVGDDSHRKLLVIFDLVSQSKKKCKEDILSTSKITGSNPGNIERHTTPDAVDCIPLDFNIKNCKPGDEIDFIICPTCDDRVLAVHKIINAHRQTLQHKQKYEKFVEKLLLTPEHSFNNSNARLRKYYFREPWPTNNKIIVLQEEVPLKAGAAASKIKITFWCTACDFKTYDILTVNKHLMSEHTTKSPRKKKKKRFRNGKMDLVEWFATRMVN